MKGKQKILNSVFLRSSWSPLYATVYLRSLWAEWCHQNISMEKFWILLSVYFLHHFILQYSCIIFQMRKQNYFSFWKTVKIYAHLTFFFLSVVILRCYSKQQIKQCVNTKSTHCSSKVLWKSLDGVKKFISYRVIICICIYTQITVIEGEDRLAWDTPSRSACTL